MKDASPKELRRKLAKMVSVAAHLAASRHDANEEKPHPPTNQQGGRMHDTIYPTADELLAGTADTEPEQPTGFLEPPAHYIGADGRETIDVMRDMCRAAARRLLVRPSSTIDVDDLGDVVFALFCQVTALGYERRAGRKGDPAGDFAKERFYLEMSTHVLHGLVDDPRSGRTTGPTSYTPGTVAEPDVGALRHSLEIR